MLLNPISKAQFIVTCSGFQMYFTTFSGINDAAESGEYPSGTRNRIFKVMGPRNVEDVTLTCPYDPEKSAEIEQFWRRYNGSYVTLTVQPTDCSDEAKPIGKPYTLLNCRLKSLNFIEVDRASGDVAEIELVLTVDDWRRG